ncbi:MAG TPA: hypothetical protein VFF27_03255 [Bacteroidia bacterium]|nr:hypothetical protein [Bacteroidia bacterium]
MKDFYLKHKALLPTILLALLSANVFLTNWIQTRSTDYTHLSNKHYFALVCAILCFSIYVLYRSVYKYVIAVTLLLGLFNIISFDIHGSAWSFRFGVLETPHLATYVMLVLLVTFFINLKHFRKWEAERKVQTKEERQEQQTQLEEDKQKFMVKFNSKTEVELHAILTDNRYTAAAKEAASFILHERNK